MEEVAGRLTLKRRSGRPLFVTGRGLAYRRSGMPSFRSTVPMRAPPLLLLRGGVGAGRGMYVCGDGDANADPRRGAW